MAISRPLTLVGEMIATLMFVKLIDVTEKVLAGRPGNEGCNRGAHPGEPESLCGPRA
jgi:hypothetical protein